MLVKARDLIDKKYEFSIGVNQAPGGIYLLLSQLTLFLHVNSTFLKRDFIFKNIIN